jgi:nucleotide-binding universal stress UspA family protein
MSFPYKRILCPIEFEGNSVDALKEAGMLGAAGNGTVIVLHAVFINPLATEGFVLAELQDSQRRDANEKLKLAAENHLHGINYELAVEIGDPGDCILEAVKQLNADLVVMTTHGRRGFTHLLLGSVAERVVRLSSVPVLTLHPAAQR